MSRKRCDHVWGSNCPDRPDAPTPHVCQKEQLHDGDHVCYCLTRKP